MYIGGSILASVTCNIYTTITINFKHHLIYLTRPPSCAIDISRILYRELLYTQTLMWYLYYAPAMNTPSMFYVPAFKGTHMKLMKIPITLSHYEYSERAC